jgi:hypothetical protein
MPFRIRLLALAVAALATLPREAVAQTTRQLGLSIGYPTALGVLWQPSARIGIRPELALDFGDSESTVDFGGFGTSRTSSEFWQAGAGIRALFLVYREENLSLYVSPRYVYLGGKTTTERDASPGILTSGDDSTKTTTHRVAGSLGVRYALSSRFGVFGELGVEHGRSKLSESEFASRVTRTGIRSDVGIVFFF